MEKQVGSGVLVNFQKTSNIPKRFLEERSFVIYVILNSLSVWIDAV